MTEWIEDWFGSEYYTLLYRHRDDREAKLFLDNLITLLKVPSNSQIVDCGCGKGRHSIYLCEKGFDVTGLDISESNIRESKKSEKKNLTFFSHDLRNLFRINYYDVALSLFTSFGYFQNDSENNKMIRSISGSLKKDGWFVLDFMNSTKESKELVCDQKCTYEGIGFDIKRFIESNFIRKEVSVSDKGKKYSFRESVKAYTQGDLEKFFSQNGLEVVHLLGDYDMNPFSEKTSERLILIGRKK